ncbi:MAG: M56 family metallopeptidase, partial [Planctomycetota bacterium]
MFIFPQQFMDVFQWLIRSSFHATILLLIILLVRAVVKKKFRFQMVYWLWMLLLLRLIWPLNLQTTFSVFNLIPQGVGPDQYLSVQAAEEPAVLMSSSGDTLASSPEIPVDPAQTTPTDVSTSSEAQTTPIRTLPLAVAAKPAPLDWRQALCTLWLAGAVVMGAYVLFSNFRLWRIIKSQRLLTRQDILELLEDCKVQLGLQTVIGIVETEKIKTPCLFGYLRPRLLLPAGALDELSPGQLRYVFLHELAHLKRHDIFIGWLMAAVQVLHWFNPAIWFAMGQISADRELACDELALSTLKEKESTEYGATILTFLERFAQQQKLPAMAGIAENQSLLRRRMTMIAKFKNKNVSYLPVLVVMLLLAATTFTSARPFSDRTMARKEAVLDNLDKNLILYYSFENDTGEKVFDLSGMDLHGKAHGAKWFEEGISSGAMSFDGKDDYISIGEMSLNAFTFSAWVNVLVPERPEIKENFRGIRSETEDRPESVQPWRKQIDNRRLFMIDNGEQCYYKIELNNQGGIGFSASDKRGIQREDIGVHEYNWFFKRGQWTHIAITYDGKSKVHIYK